VALEKRFAGLSVNLLRSCSLGERKWGFGSQQGKCGIIPAGVTPHEKGEDQRGKEVLVPSECSEPKTP